MVRFPDEANLIESMWGLICNSMDLKHGEWNSSPDSAEWLTVMRRIRNEYHNWLGYYLVTHQVDPHADESPSLGQLIESLKTLCDCGNCDGAWVSRFEANHIVAKLKRLAELETENR